MDDLISRATAIDALEKHEKTKGHNYSLFVDVVSECEEIIRNLPSAQPEKVCIANITLSEEQIREVVEKVKNEVVQVLPSAEPERNNIWHKVIFEGFPAESDQVLVTDGKYFWVDESVANDVGLEWACFDGCWEDTEWAYFSDLYNGSKPERKTGKWEVNEHTYAGVPKNWKCTNCCDGYYDFITTSISKPKWKYCPNCGAKMEVEQDD